MSNYIMQVDFFGNSVRCETEGLMVSLNDLFNAGNLWRLQNKMPVYQMHAFLNSAALTEYVKAAADEWCMPADKFITRAGKGKTTRTMVHISVAILAAEQISPAFHAKVHRTFVEGKLLEFRDHGGTEFKSLNAALDMRSQEVLGKPAHKGHFIQVATLLRARLLNEGQDWNTASVAQTHRRWEAEQTLVKLLQLGVVRDWEHLKELIGKV